MRNVDDVSNSFSVLYAATFVEMSVQVLLNVAMALGASSAFTAQYPLHKRSPSRSESPTPVKPSMLCLFYRRVVLQKGFSDAGRKSVHCRPLRFQSIARSAEEDASSDEGSFTFADFSKGGAVTQLEDSAHEIDSLNSKSTKNSSVTFPTLLGSSSLTPVPEHALLRGFVRTPSQENPVRKHARHLSLDEKTTTVDFASFSPKSATMLSMPPSPFLEEGVVEALELVDRVDAPLITIEETRSDKSDGSQESPVKEKQIKQEIRLNDSAKQVENESSCSSPRSIFSDTAASKFVSNFCNPEFGDETDLGMSAGVGGSIRQRYTIRRLQSLLSHRSRMSIQTPGSMEDSYSVVAKSQRSTMRSFRHRGLNSFRSRASGCIDENPVLSDAYQMVRLESCIRRAWKLTHDDRTIVGNQSFRGSEDKQSLNQSINQSVNLRSFKRMASRFDRNRRISFVRVPSDADGYLRSRREMLLNPAFGDEIAMTEDYESDDETDLDTSSVTMRTPLKKLGQEEIVSFDRCQKNLEKGEYNNPLRCCSFRSYDSDTELELSSVRMRNPISRLLSFRVNRGVTKDGIALAEIGDDEYGSLMFDQVNANPIRDGMLDKYLTQVAIDSVLKPGMMEEEVKEEEEGDCVGWSTCQQEYIPQEMDEELKCFLMDRFLLDNVLNEMDVNMGALEIARVKDKKQRTPYSGPVQESIRPTLESNPGPGSRRVLRRS